MIESLILLTIVVVGGLALIMAIGFLITAGLRQSKRLLKIGLKILLIPLFFCLLLYWFYSIYIPNKNIHEAATYMGTYTLVEGPNNSQSAIGDKPQPRLILNGDNSFWLDENEWLHFTGPGTWKAGGIDGLFEFEQDGRIIFWAMPSEGNKLQVNASTKGPQLMFIK